MPRKIREFEKLNCDYCGKEFTPTNPRQRACNKKKCKRWILGQNRYKPVKYGFSQSYLNTKNFSIKDLSLVAYLKGLEFTKNDLIKIGDKNE